MASYDSQPSLAMVDFILVWLQPWMPDVETPDLIRCRHDKLEADPNLLNKRLLEPRCHHGAMNLQFARGSQHTQVKRQGRLHVDVGVHDRVRQADAAQMQIRCPGKALDGVPYRLGQRDVDPLCGHRPVHLGGTRDIDCRCGFIEQQLPPKLTSALLDRVGH